MEATNTNATRAACRRAGKHRRGCMVKKTTATVCGAVLASCMVPSAAFAQAVDDSDYGNAEKTQVVYVKTGDTGDTEGVYVVNQFESRKKTTVRDAGSYESVSNLTDEQELDPSGVSSFTVKAGEAYLYQGNLGTKEELPWSIELGYKLDGRNVGAAELAGASGELEMSLSVKPNGACKGNYADNYLLQISGSIDNTLATGIDAPKATTAQAKGSMQLSYMVFPGKSADYSIKAQVRDFEFDGWQIVGVPLAIALDIDDEFSESAGELDKLEDATATLDEGAQKLDEGAAKLALSMNKLESGSMTLSDGLGALAQSGEKLKAGAEELRSGVDDKAVQLDAAAETIDASSAQSAYAQATQSYTIAFASAFSQAYASAYRSLVAAGAGEREAQQQARMQAADSAAQETKSQQAAVEEALGALIKAKATKSSYESAASALKEVSSSCGQLASGVGSYADAASRLAEGAGNLYDGMSSAGNGAGSLAAGADTLAGGTAELSEKAKGIGEELTDEIRAKLTDYLNPSFTLYDFVNGSSEGIENVQFVYMTPAIEIPATDEEEAAAEDNRSFAQKFLALFGL